MTSTDKTGIENNLSFDYISNPLFIFIMMIDKDVPDTKTFQKLAWQLRIGKI